MEDIRGPFRSHMENCDYITFLLWDKKMNEGVEMVSFKPKSLKEVRTA